MGEPLRGGSTARSRRWPRHSTSPIRNRRPTSAFSSIPRVTTLRRASGWPSEAVGSAQLVEDLGLDQGQVVAPEPVVRGREGPRLGGVPVALEPPARRCEPARSAPSGPWPSRAMARPATVPRSGGTGAAPSGAACRARTGRTRRGRGGRRRVGPPGSGPGGSGRRRRGAEHQDRAVVVEDRQPVAAARLNPRPGDRTRPTPAAGQPAAPVGDGPQVGSGRGTSRRASVAEARHAANEPHDLGDTVALREAGTSNRRRDPRAGPGPTGRATTVELVLRRRGDASRRRGCR